MEKINIDKIKVINMTNVKMLPAKTIKISTEQLFKSGRTPRQIKEALSRYGMNAELV